jgi:hypothetical protein
VVKRRDLIREIRVMAPTAVLTEGGSHTRIEINGQLITTIPRHREIAEGTARNIIRLIKDATT